MGLSLQTNRCEGRWGGRASQAGLGRWWLGYPISVPRPPCPRTRRETVLEVSHQRTSYVAHPMRSFLKSLAIAT